MRINFEYVKKLREEKEMSRSETARAIGISPSYYTNVECGRNPLSDKYAYKLAHILGTTPDKIMAPLTNQQLIRRDVRTKRGEKRYWTPEDFNKTLQSTRSPEMEAFEYERVLSRETQMISGDDIIVSIAVNCLTIPEWQRKTDSARARNMFSDGNYRWYSYDNIKVFAKDGHLYVVDGAHRVLGYFLNGRKFIKAILLKSDCVTEEEVVDAFMLQGVSRRQMPQSDIWRAAVYSNKTAYTGLRNVASKHGVVFEPDAVQPASRKATVVPAKSMLTKNPGEIDFIYSLIDASGWKGDKAYSAKTVSMFSNAFKRVGTKPFMEDISAIKGDNFFKENIRDANIGSGADAIVSALGY